MYFQLGVAVLFFRLEQSVGAASLEQTHENVCVRCSLVARISVWVSVVVVLQILILKNFVL